MLFFLFLVVRKWRAISCYGSYGNCLSQVNECVLKKITSYLSKCLQCHFAWMSVIFVKVDKCCGTKKKEKCRTPANNGKTSQSCMCNKIPRSPSLWLNCEHWITQGCSPLLSCRPAAGSRAREVSSGEEQGAGARPAADVLHQPGTVAGDWGRRDVLHAVNKTGVKRKSGHTGRWGTNILSPLAAFKFCT